MGGSAPTLNAKGKGQEKSTKKFKSKKHKKQKIEKWIPPGLSKEEKTEWKEGVPPGWSKGKTTGWGGSDEPPGWSKWKKKDKKKWKKDLSNAKKKAEKWAKKRSRKYDWKNDREEEEAEKLYISVDRTARSGVPVNRVEDLVEKAIKKDMGSDDIERLTRAVAHGVGQGIGAEEVVVFTEKVLDGEIKDEDVVLGIYRWVAKEAKK